jgi:hypothetical protein
LTGDVRCVYAARAAGEARSASGCLGDAHALEVLDHAYAVTAHLQQGEDN